METITKLAVQNFLSLRSVNINFTGLDVLVGPNGAGKSNILKAFEFLGLVARYDLVPSIDVVGGFSNIRFRGDSLSKGRVSIEVEGNVTTHASARAPDRYMLEFTSVPMRFRRKGQNDHSETRTFISRHEEIALKRTPGRGRRITLRGGDVNFGWEGSSPRKSPGPIKLQETSTGLATLRRLGEEYDAEQVEALADVFENLRLFEINVDKAREPSRISSERPRLNQDADNLAHFLSWLADAHRETFNALCDDVRFVLPSFQQFEFEDLGGAEKTISVGIRERHLNGVTPLSRASFGTIRAIALFAMLHDPEPPRLTCLEELDHGLHPHALDRIVRRLRDASSRTQIIAATHSPALVNRLAYEELIVVERNRENGETEVFRPNHEIVRELEKEGMELGEIWFSGILGGGL